MKKGFSTVELLIGILLSFYVVILCTNALKLVNFDFDSFKSRDIISSLQLYDILNVSIEVDVHPDKIEFMYFNETRVLELVNNKIILKPGTVIYYLNIDEYKFYTENDKIYLEITRKNKSYHYLIGEL